MRRRARALALMALVVPAAGSPAAAWLIPGHRRVTADAVALLPATVPEILRGSASAVAAAAGEPDLWRNRATPALADGEFPEHYLDRELLAGAKLPPLRSEFEAVLRGLGLEGRTVGYLPYAVLEGVERLTVCLAEHRVRPEDPFVPERCRLYAGWLAHYAEDLEQPLHTSIHHDGWALPTGESTATGIHFLIDDLFTSAVEPEAALAGLPEPTAFADPVAAIREELAVSHRLLDLVYSLEPALRGQAGASDPRVAAFACARYRATALFVARLFATAWERSAKVEVPLFVGG